MKTFAQQLDECIEHAFVQSNDGDVEKFMTILLRSANMSVGRARYVAQELKRRTLNNS